MGLPTRLHGDQVLDKAGLVKDFCPRCSATRDWVVVKNKGTFFKCCTKCGIRKEIRDPKIIQEIKGISSNIKTKKSGNNKEKKDKK